jgi:phosphatidylinositol alpha-mannosyltransferase
MAWHAILDAAPLWRRPRRRDAMQGTFIGVLMSSTQPARLGERSRSLIVARRLGRARETLPIVLATMISQTIINLLALVVLGAAVFSSVDPLDGRHGPLLIAALAPLVGLAATLAFPALIPSRALPRSARIEALVEGARRWVGRAREGFALFRRRRVAARALVRQLGAWGLQLLSCWLLLMAFGLDASAGIGGAAAVLFAVNATAVLPATPANVGVFQVACASVLIGAYHVSTPDAIAFSIVLQVIELLTAVVMGVPALINEGMSLREVRLRTLHAAPVKLAPLPAGSDALAGRASLERA